MADYGIKWVKDTADVNTAGLEDTLITSQYPLLKVQDFGNSSVNYDNDGTTTDILVATHSLGYIPLTDLIIQWYDVDSAAKQTSFRHTPLFDGLFLDLGTYFKARSYASTTELRLEVESFDGNGGNFDLDYYYRIYYDPDSNP